MNTVKPWLDSVGKFTVEHIPCPHYAQPVNLVSPRTGCLHTTEGHWDDGLAVFKQHFAPHFLVGAGRIAQLVQVGVIGASLVHHNADAIVQVEVVGFSKQELWTPDDATAEVLASLMAVCQSEYGIPLAHPWADGDYGLYGDNPHRHAGKWGVIAGWYGHGDVPSLAPPAAQENHWDPGALKWSALFAKAAAMTDILHAPAWTAPPASPRPCIACSTSPVVIPTAPATVAAPPAPLPPPPATSLQAAPAASADPMTWCVRYIQSFLVAAGYDLDIDGLMDPNGETVKALADYRAKHGD